MPDQSARPFLPFAAGPKNQLRQKVRGGGPKPRESAAHHGQNLIRQAEAFQKTIEDQAARRDPDLPPLPDDLQVIIEAKRLQPEQARSLGLTPIEEREEGILVTVSPDVTLPTLVSKAQSYVTERTDSGNPRYGGVMAPIDQIRPANRDDKAGDHLKRLIAADNLPPDQLLWLDVELAGGDTDLGGENRQQFYNYLDEFGAAASPYAEDVVTATSNFLVEPDYSLHRVQLPLRAVLDLLDDSRANWILSMDVVPMVEERTMPPTTGADGTLPEMPALPADAPRVVIIDSGLAADHPLFRDARGRTIIGRQFSFLPETVADEQSGDQIRYGHGTAIASIVAYGSLQGLGRAEVELSQPVFWLESAKIFLPAIALEAQGAAEQPCLHPAQFPKSLMREVVTAFHHPMPQQCKIFNLSAGTGAHPRQAMSNWAEELDNLSAQNDVLFVITSGNLTPPEIIALIAVQGSYPEYLLDEAARLRDPGQAYHALTVGALTADPLTPWQRGQILAPSDHPAPFTRNGLPHPGGVVKPDVVEFGGNLSRQGNDLVGAPELGVLVANRDYVAGQAEQPLSFHYGAGLAAARVSHLAGHIQAQYPSASANLIRALIANSAEWPEALVRTVLENAAGSLSKTERQTLLRLSGYGVPQTDKALSANAHCMVFVTEDKFSWVADDRNSSGRYPAKVSFFSVRLEPDDLFRLPPATQVRVSVTLAYNPAVRKTQRRRYQAVDMRWELKRREESSEDFYARWMREAEGSEDEEQEESDGLRPRPWPWQLKPVLNPGGRVRRGSLIRDWFDTFVQDLPHTLEIVTLAMVAPWRKPPDPLSQNFALVVSIESLDQAVPIYDTVRVQTNGAE